MQRFLSLIFEHFYNCIIIHSIRGMLIWTWEYGTCVYDTPASIEMALLWAIHWLSRRYDSQFVLLASINFLSITLIDKQIYWSLDSFSLSLSLILHCAGCSPSPPKPCQLSWKAPTVGELSHRCHPRLHSPLAGQPRLQNVRSYSKLCRSNKSNFRHGSAETDF